jgi:SH3 domain protein
MKKPQWLLSLIVFCLLGWQGNGLAETMYVTDRLYLSLRSAPDLEQPAMGLLPSDTKVEVLTREGDWAQVKLEDGRTGWVLKRFLVNDLPKSLVIEELKSEIENKNAMLETLQKENTPLKKETSDRATVETKQKALLERIDRLKSQIANQKKRIEVNTKEQTVKRLKEVYMIGLATLFLGLIAGYMLRKPKKRQMFS